MRVISNTFRLYYGTLRGAHGLRMAMVMLHAIPDPDLEIEETIVVSSDWGNEEETGVWIRQITSLAIEAMRRAGQYSEADAATAARLQRLPLEMPREAVEAFTGLVMAYRAGSLNTIQTTGRTMEYIHQYWSHVAWNLSQADWDRLIIKTSSWEGEK